MSSEYKKKNNYRLLEGKITLKIKINFKQFYNVK